MLRLLNPEQPPLIRHCHQCVYNALLNEGKPNTADRIGDHIRSVMAGRRLHDWFFLFDVHLVGHSPGLDQAQQSDFNTLMVMCAPFLQVTIWILHVTVPSHTINLSTVLVLLSILQRLHGL